MCLFDQFMPSMISAHVRCETHKEQSKAASGDKYCMQEKSVRKKMHLHIWGLDFLC